MYTFYQLFNMLPSRKISITGAIFSSLGFYLLGIQITPSIDPLQILIFITINLTLHRRFQSNEVNLINVYPLTTRQKVLYTFTNMLFFGIIWIGLFIVINAIAHFVAPIFIYRPLTTIIIDNTTIQEFIVTKTITILYVIHLLAICLPLIFIKNQKKYFLFFLSSFIGWLIIHSVFFSILTNSFTLSFNPLLYANSSQAAFYCFSMLIFSLLSVAFNLILSIKIAAPRNTLLNH